MDFYLEDNFLQGKHQPILIIKYNNNKTKIKSFEESIDINKIFNYPVFNIADISVVIGVILLICYIIVKNNNRQENS